MDEEKILNLGRKGGQITDGELGSKDEMMKAKGREEEEGRSGRKGRR